MPPATASRSFARQNAPVVSHSYPRTPIVRPLLTQQPAPFPNIANGSLYIHPFDSAKLLCPLLQSTRSVKARLKQRAEKRKKTRWIASSNHLSLATRRKKNLSAPRQQASYSTRRSSPSPHDNKQSKEKAEAMPPFKLFSRHSATIGKKQKRIPSPPQLKKRAATGHPAARQQIEKTPQPDTLRPTPPLPPAPIFSPRPVSNSLRRPPFQIFCAALASLKHLPAKRVEKTFNKKLYPAAKTPDAPDTKPSSNTNTQQKTRKKTSFTQNT